MRQPLVPLLALLAVCCRTGSGQVTVPMSQYNPSRTAANLQERILKPSNVNPERFGRLFTRQVDDTVYALPLIIPGVEIEGSPRNLLLIATMSNTVYAFDADDPARAAPYWSRNLGTPGVPDAWIGPDNWGILSTPYVDVESGTLYAVARARQGSETGLWLHALDLHDGRPKFNSPRRLTFPFQDGPTLSDIGPGIQRAGLLVTGDTLVVAFANILPEPDRETQEGFLQSFDASDLSQRRGTFQVTPAGLKGGIWQAGRGIATDGEGFIYVATAGGSYDGVTNFGSSVLKLTARELDLVDWFTPTNFDELYHGNIDISANGVTLIPGSSLMFAGGKEGVIYLLDRSDLGRLESEGGAPVQRFQASQGCGPTDCAQTLGTAFWSLGEEGMLYVWDRRDILRSYRFADGKFETTASAASAVQPEMTSGPSLSANGSGLDSGIVWAVTVDRSANSELVPGTLRAFRASNVAEEIYNSDVHPERDAPGNFTKFAAPVVANGKVYVVTHSHAVAVYGLLDGGEPDGSITSVVNTGDYTPRLAPHSLTSIFGDGLATQTCDAKTVPLPNELCGVSVLATDKDGSEALAPLLFVSPGQINLQMPVTQFAAGKDPPRKEGPEPSAAFCGSSGTSALCAGLLDGGQICVEPAHACAAITVDQEAPAIFTYLREPGVIDPIVVHANGALVSPAAPASWGETLVLYATGFGRPSEDFPADGEPAPTDRLVELESGSVVFLASGAGSESGDPLPAAFAGLAPGYIGLYQVNVTLPGEPPSAGDVFLFLKGPAGIRSPEFRLYTQ